jgi:hypothetical protein
MMISSDFLLYSKERLDPGKRWRRRYDLLLSAFNGSERVRMMFDRISAREKRWVVLPEYGYPMADWPAQSFGSDLRNESEFLGELLASLGGTLQGKTLAIDITGFVNHYVIALLHMLRLAGVEACDVYYGEPAQYRQKERTKFSDEGVLDVRQIAGFEGCHNINTAHDILIIAVGYDHRLVAEVANRKEHTQKIPVYGLPSLRADMYQESLLRISQIEGSLGPEASHPAGFAFAPANDPFVTAAVVADLVDRHRLRFPESNVYLSPLSTKAQALGFGFYYLRNAVNSACSIIYPMCANYARETSTGLSGAWMYRLELSALWSHEVQHD